MYAGIAPESTRKVILSLRFSHSSPPAIGVSRMHNKTISKPLADYLREHYKNASGVKLKAGHAYELVAAYFGYKTHISMLSDTKLNTLLKGESIAFIENQITQLNDVPFSKEEGALLYDLITNKLALRLRNE